MIFDPVSGYTHLGCGRITICETLGAIGSIRPRTLQPLLSDIYTILTDLLTVRKPTEDQTQTKVMLCTLVFQIFSGYELSSESFSIVSRTVEDNNLWANYRIARAAVRYGHHNVALNVFTALTEQVSSENLHFWMVCLREMCKAESLLVSRDSPEQIVDRINGAVVHYNMAIGALKVSTVITVVVILHLICV